MSILFTGKARPPAADPERGLAAAAIAAARLAFWEWDSKTGRETWSPELGRLLAAAWPQDSPPDDPSLRELMGPRQRAALDAAVERAQRTGQPFELTLRIGCRGEEALAVRLRGNLVAGDGARVAAVCCGVDDSQRLEAEERLRTSEERLRMALSAAKQGMWDLDVTTGDVVVSPGYSTMLGYDPDDLVESEAGWISRLHPDDRQRSIDHYQAYLAGSTEEYSSEFRLRDNAGNWVWIYSVGKIVARDEAGRPLRMIGTHTDITGVKVTQERLALAERRYRLLFEQSPDAVLLVDPETVRIVEFNNAALAMLGYTAREMAELTIPQIEAAETPAEVAAHVRRALQQGGDRFETRHRTRSGEVIDVSVSIRVVEIDGRRMFHTVCREITAEKNAKRQLQASAELLRVLIESTPAGVAMLDREMRYLACSRRWYRDFGLEQHELVGRKHTELYPNQRRRWLKIYARCLEGHVERRDEDRFRRADGTIETFRWECQPWRGPDGEVAGLCFFTELTTAQKRTEAELLAANHRLRSVLDALFGHVVLLSLDGRIVEVNRAPLELAGLSREEVLGRPIWEIYPLAHSPQVQELIRGLVRGAAQGALLRHDLPIRLRDGRRLVIDAMAGPLRDPHGRIVNLIGFGVDVTQRTRAEEILRDSEQFIRAAMDSLGVNIAVVDAQGTIVRTNQRWDEFAARSQVCWNAVTVGANYLGACRRAAANGIAEAGQIERGISELLAGSRDAFDTQYCCPTSEGLRWFLCRGTRFDSQRQVCAVVAHSDITEIKRANDRIQALQQQLTHAGRVATLGEMAAGIAHELNQPLAAIELLAEGCLESRRAAGGLPRPCDLSLPADGPSTGGDPLAKIVALADRCGQIIRRLRRYASNQQSPRTTVDVRPLVETVASFLASEMRLAEVVCELRLPAQPLWIRADAIQIQQLLLNLVKNAIEAQTASQRPRRIEIAAGHSVGGRVRVAVRDHGHGIAPAVADRLFAPFFTTKSGGLGMGLKICQTIVRDHGGEIAGCNEPSGGSTFSIWLPIAEPSA